MAFPCTPQTCFGGERLEARFYLGPAGLILRGLAAGQGVGPGKN